MLVTPSANGAMMEMCYAELVRQREVLEKSWSEVNGVALDFDEKELENSHHITSNPRILDFPMDLGIYLEQVKLPS